MRRRFSDADPRTVKVYSFVLAAMMFGLGVAVLRQHLFWRTQREAEADVTAVEKKSSRGVSQWYADYTFTAADGREYTGRSRVQRKYASVGSKLPIRYCEETPEKNTADEQNRLFYCTVFFALGAGALAAGFVIH